MPTLSIDIPSGVSARVVDAICSTQGYKETIPDPSNPDGQHIQNPQTKLQFVKAHLVAYMKDIVVRYEAQKASDVAAAAAASSANSDINLT